MAGQIIQVQGADPAIPAATSNSTYPNVSGQMKSISGNGRQQILSATDRPNLLMNSGLWFAQRQAAATLTTYSATADRAKGPDGWAFTNENASVQYIRVDTSSAPESGLQGRFYGSVTKITANGKIVLTQVIEGTDCQAIRGRTVTFQLWMKSTTAMTLRLGVFQLTSAGTIDAPPATFISAFGGASTDPTLGANVSYIAPNGSVTPDNGSTVGNAVNCSVTTTWQRFGACFNIPTTVKNVFVAIWSDSQITTTNGFSWSQASLTDGYEIQEWNPLPVMTEKLRCMRFYQKSFIEATAPATNVGANTGESKGIAGKATAVANAGFIWHRFSPPMHHNAAMTLFNPAAANALMRNETGAADMGATTVTATTENDTLINATGVAATAVGDLVGIHWTAEAAI